MIDETLLLLLIATVPVPLKFTHDLTGYDGADPDTSSVEEPMVIPDVLSVVAILNS